MTSRFAAALALILCLAVPLAKAAPKKADLKEWTLIIFLNGNNNLAKYTIADLNEMEQAGSSDDVNVVVQWAHKDFETTKRLLIKKDDDPKNVTSPVLEEFPRVDMGNPQTLVDFIRWSVEHYPAKRYMVEIWNHGHGWHDRHHRTAQVDPNISDDDFSHNNIDTPELGAALKSAAQIMGHKVDLYGSDACLMASLEVATELSESTQYMLGSEELEEMDGWEYSGFIKKLNKSPESTPVELGVMITDAYFKANPDYSDLGGMGLSVVDLSQVDALNAAIADLGQGLLKAGEDDLASVWQAADMAQRFWYAPDYHDLGHLIYNLQVGVRNEDYEGLDATKVQNLKILFDKVIAYNHASPNYVNAKGLTIWLPQWKKSYEEFRTEYSQLRFTKLTGWDKVLQGMVKEL